MTRTQLTLRLSALALFAVVGFVSTPAYAGHWAVSFQCSGKTVDRPIESSASTGYYGGAPVTTVWPMQFSPANNLVSFGRLLRHVWTSQKSGTVTPILTWVQDSFSDTSSPPSTAIIQETTYAEAWSYIGDLSGPLTVDDGLGDPSFRQITGSPLGSPYVEKSVSASGTRIVSHDTGGQSVITFDPVTLASNSGFINDNGDFPDVVMLKVSVLYPVTAASTAGTVDPKNPAWFSGTACTAVGIADLNLLYGGQVSGAGIPSGDYITSATLKIGGSIVKSYPEDYIGKLPPSGLTAIPNLAVMWDSTHFADGSPVAVEVEVYDAKGKNYKADLTAPAYNKLLSLGNQSQFGSNAVNSVSEAGKAAYGVNYNVDSSLNDTVATIFGKLPKYTAFYIDSHGGVGNLTDCVGDGNDADHVFGGIEVSNALKAKSPVSPPTFPPYNFAMFDACIVMGNKYDNPSSDDDAAMSAGFGLAQGTDRAALGFDWYTYSWASNSDWTKRLWTYLAQGVPLRQAASLSNAEGQIKGKPSPLFGVPFGFYSNLNPVIQGDSNMKLHGVYGGLVTSDGVGGLDIPWYRPLQ